MKRLFFFICIIAMLMIPASAQTTSFTAPADKAVWAIDIDAPTGSTGTITLNLANGDVVTGSWSYLYTIFPAASLTTQLGSDSSTMTYVTGLLPMNMQIWNGDNVTYSRYIKLGSGQNRPWWNNVVQTHISASPIVSYTIESDLTVDVSEETISFKEAEANLNRNPNDKQGLVALIEGYSGLVIAVFLSLIYWLKFLFVDNLVLVIALYLTGSMAYAINTSKNIFAFYKTWFKQQAAMFNFIANAFTTVFQLATQVAAIIGNTVGTIATIAASILTRLI